MECANCYTELTNIETEDFEFGDENTIFLYFSGHCPNCKKSFEWREEYSLNYEGYDRMQEIKDTRLLL